MADFSFPDQAPSPEKAQEHYNNAIYFKSQGQTDKALTEFRRAVIANPNHIDSLMEIGTLCKAKANGDPIFRTHAHDAFRKAASLDINNQDAHDQYIMMAHKLGRLEDVFEEYKNLQKKHPDHEIIERCTKNIMTMTLALIPENVAIESQSGKLRKAVLLISLLVFLLGLSLIMAPPLVKKVLKVNLTKDDMGKMAKSGMAMLVLSGVGFVVRSRIN